jgi:hypothetical protein
MKNVVETNAMPVDNVAARSLYMYGSYLEKEPKDHLMEDKTELQEKVYTNVKKIVEPF